MSEKIEYDGASQVVKIYRTMPDAKSLVPNEELRKWTKVAQDGKDEKGRAVKAVRYIFDDPDAARYNHQPLAFAGLQTFVVEGGKENPVGDDPSFSTREDFGIDGE